MGFAIEMFKNRSNCFFSEEDNIFLIRYAFQKMNLFFRTNVIDNQSVGVVYFFILLNSNIQTFC